MHRETEQNQKKAPLKQEMRKIFLSLLDVQFPIFRFAILSYSFLSLPPQRWESIRHAREVSKMSALRPDPKRHETKIDRDQIHSGIEAIATYHVLMGRPYPWNHEQ
jgi:hypothetical protein